jgi:hypothetical protein
MFLRRELQEERNDDASETVASIGLALADTAINQGIAEGNIDLLIGDVADISIYSAPLISQP